MGSVWGSLGRLCLPWRSPALVEEFEVIFDVVDQGLIALSLGCTSTKMLISEARLLKVKGSVM